MNSIGQRLHDFFETPIQWAWITLLVPSLFAIKFGAGSYDFWHDYPRAWVIHTVPFVCMLIPLQLTYHHLPALMQPSDRSSWRAVPFHALILIFWGVVGHGIGDLLVSPLYLPLAEDPTGEFSEGPGIMFLAFLFGTPIFLRGIFYREQLEESRSREIRAQREALAAQVQALQARIEPHFLFNSLNAVASLVGEDPVRAERALEKIADLFRYALDSSNGPFVPLARELEAVEGFLELEQLRFPGQFSVALHVEPGIGEVQVPPFSLQPLVENAVRHGIAPRNERGRLELEIRRSEGELQVRVEDDGPGPGASSHKGAGAAVADLRKRLELLYGDRASLEIDRGSLDGCRVMLRLPLRAEER